MHWYVTYWQNVIADAHYRRAITPYHGTLVSKPKVVRAAHADGDGAEKVLNGLVVGKEVLANGARNRRHQHIIDCPACKKTPLLSASRCTYLAKNAIN